MSDKSDKAKETVKAAADKVGDLAEKAIDKAGELLAKVEEKAEELSHKEGIVGKGASLVDKAFDKVHGDKDDDDKDAAPDGATHGGRRGRR